MSCSVCFDNFNNSTKKATNCPSCETKICRSCLQNYLLNDISDNSKCVNTQCKYIMDRDFLDSELTSHFRLNVYRKYREQILLDREISKLPSTQEHAITYRDAFASNGEVKTKLAQLKVERLQLNQQIIKLERDYRMNNFAIESYGRTNNSVVGAVRMEFIKPCTDNDCKGFLSSGYKCGLCNKFTCSKCNDLLGLDKNIEHTCDPDKVATIEFIKNDSRPCPKCGVNIHKIDGCNQMWCTNCNTAFDYRSGKIADGQVHNPHYFAWLARNPQAHPINQACNDLGDTQIIRLLHRIPGRFNAVLRTTAPDTFPSDSHKFVYNVLILGREIENYGLITEEIINPQGHRTVITHGQRTREIDVNEAYRILRVRYLSNQITREVWKSELQKTEKKINFHRSKSQLFDLFIQASRDSIRQILPPTNKNVAEIASELEILIAYFNDESKKVENRFARIVGQIKINMT